MERKRYPEEFKRNAVELLLTSGKNQKELSAELGLPYGLLGRWRKEIDLDNPKNAALKAVAEERIKALEKEVSILKQERDILKKAMGIALKP